MENKLLLEIARKLDRLEWIENELKELRTGQDELRAGQSELRVGQKDLQKRVANIEMIIEKGVFEDVRRLEKRIEILESKVG